MNLRKLVCSTTVVLASSLVCVCAVADSGVYLGGGVTSTKIEESAGNPGGVPFNDTATGGKLFAGYHIDAIPLFKFAGEVGYRESGQAKESQAIGDVKYRLHGFDYAVLAGIGLGPVDLMARVGGMSYKLEKDIVGVKNKFDGTAPVYGLGLWFTLVGVGIRAEYERIDIDELDKADMISVSAFYQF